MRIMFLLLAGFIAISAQAYESWQKEDLTTPGMSPSKFLFGHAGADTVYFPVISNNDIGKRVQSPPVPVQQISEPATAQFSDQSAKLAGKIFKTMGVDLHDSKTKHIRTGFENFRAGLKNDLSARLFAYSSVDADGDKYLTCVAVVHDHQKVRAIFVKGWPQANANCSRELVDLTRSEVFFE